MEKISFRMQLNEGQLGAYKQRHDAIWPELVTLLHDAGISDYSIFLHEPTHSLFAVLQRRDDHTMDRLPLEPLMQQWWKHMADIMQTHDNDEPVVETLIPVFHME